MFKTFAVKLVRSVDPSSLEWPQPGQAISEYGLGQNREYVDLRRFTWGAVERILRYERSLMDRLKPADRSLEELEEELEETNDRLFGLDVGVASAVVALSASRCVPFTSCNAGAFSDGGHFEVYPLVAFYAKPPWVPILLATADRARIGLTNNGGAVVAFVDDIYKLAQFAKGLYQRRGEINRLRLREHSPSRTKCEQLSFVAFP
jgi:hypothetical protein